MAICSCELPRPVSHQWTSFMDTLGIVHIIFSYDYCWQCCVYEPRIVFLK